jgi:hypothetical protein
MKVEEFTKENNHHLRNVTIEIRREYQLNITWLIGGARGSYTHK